MTDSNTADEALIEEMRDKLRITNIFEKELIKNEDEINRLNKIILKMDDEADELKETIDSKQSEILAQNETIFRLRGLLYEILKKNNKDADYIDEIFDKDFDEYEDEIIAAYDLSLD
jgi:hypothetical protein